MIETPAPPHASAEPIASIELRDLVVAQLDRFCCHHGDRLGRVLWDRALSDFALITAERIDADVAVWFAENGSLAPVFNGPRAESLVDRYSCPLGSGILGQAYVMEQSFGGEADPEGGFLLDPEMDRLLGIRTVSHLVTPLYFGASLRGVVSASRFVEASQTTGAVPAPFDENDVLRFECLVAALGRLFDERIFARSFELQ